MGTCTGRHALEQFISPVVLYMACALGAAGVALALPRRGSKLVPLGGVLIAGAAGLAAIGLGSRAGMGGWGGVGFFFYVFAAIGLGASVRMITHPRPVYSALYFILTIIASCGLYLLLGAEFMAFALIIIYAGAILITYIFVIMLATQAPTGTTPDMLDEADAVGREPIVGAVLGFVLVAVISTMLLDGVATMRPPASFEPNAVLADLPRKVDRALRDADLIGEDERVVRLESGRAFMDATTRTIVVINEETGTTRTLGPDRWPDELGATNLDRLGWNLLNDHPMTIEIAGVILLMAMLGATVLSRKQVELDESLKAEQAGRLGAPVQPRHGGARGVTGGEA
jgi:NADH-quinone oxidoreductase subunit J